MLNKIMILLGIIIILFISFCNIQQSSQTIDCDTFLKSENLIFNTDKAVDKYLEDIKNENFVLKQKKIRKEYHNCTKGEILYHYLMVHPQIDSVSLTPSGHGISFFRIDTNVWGNIIID